ncbi:hypothetical protein BOTCAL_0080g00040 [Botryotinia calthae]|uniref:Uncharacterized protein n=1 Tax=Botryotinia calthae TaxID=38488 RepID=A0A4Y8D7Y1_9HELO|nr:hypothetical protein BOTCAL_0080g00040 [Botryotinia calthae]
MASNRRMRIFPDSSRGSFRQYNNRNLQLTCKQFNNENNRQYHRNEMPGKTVKGASANDVPLRQIIFSQPLSAYNIPLIKHINKPLSDSASHELVSYTSSRVLNQVEQTK